jgi:hypothetical protein
MFNNMSRLNTRAPGENHGIDAGQGLKSERDAINDDFPRSNEVDMNLRPREKRSVASQLTLWRSAGSNLRTDVATLEQAANSRPKLRMIKVSAD